MFYIGHSFVLIMKVFMSFNLLTATYLLANESDVLASGTWTIKSAVLGGEGTFPAYVLTLKYIVLSIS